MPRPYFVLGVSAYSGELKRKSSYLVFMTPHSTLAIVASKLLFTLAVGLLFAALATFLLIADMPVLTEYYGEWTGYYLLFDELLLQRGVSLSKIAMGVALTVTQLFLEVLSIVAVAYFSITLSATILQNRKARGLLSFLFFALIVFALTRISGLLWMETAFEGGVTISFAQALAPSIVESALVLLAALFGNTRSSVAQTACEPLKQKGKSPAPPLRRRAIFVRQRRFVRPKAETAPDLFEGRRRKAPRANIPARSMHRRA